MKNDIAFFIFIILLFLPIILFAKTIVDFDYFKKEFENERMIQNQNVENLKTEIRLLKQDVFILENGYEVGK